MENARPRRSRRPSEAGFSLLQLMVALLVLTQILVAVLVLFDSLNRTSRVQTQVADMQQSLRIAQYDVLRLLRMAGRGGLQANLVPTAIAPALFGTAIDIRENAGAGSPPEQREVAIGW